MGVSTSAVLAIGILINGPVGSGSDSRRQITNEDGESHFPTMALLTSGGLLGEDGVLDPLD